MQEQQAQFESIDRMKTEGMIHAEKKCQSLCMGEVDFSPDVNIAKGQRYIWQMIVHKWRGKHVSSKKIHRMAKAASWYHGKPSSNKCYPQGCQT